MRRVVVTGLGIVSSLGNNTDEVIASLKAMRSGIRFCETYQELGFRSHIHGAIDIDIDAAIDRKLRRFMGDGAAYNYIAMEQAITDAGLEEHDISNQRTGLVMGSGGPSTSNQVTAADITADGGIIALRGYEQVWMWLRTESDIGTTFAAGPCSAPYPSERQGEALAFNATGSGYYTVSEGTHSAVNYVGPADR